MARRGQRGSGSTRTAPRQQRGNDGIIPVLAKAVREVEAEAERGRIRPGSRTRFQVIALLVREERARVKADTEHGEAWKEEQLRRLDGVATILAKTSVRDPSLLALLAEDAVVSDSARDLKRDMLKAAGFEVPEVEEVRARDAACSTRPARSTSSRSRWSRASWRTRSWSPTSPPPRPGRAPTGCRRGSCSARSSAPSSTAASRRACRCPSRPTSTVATCATGST